MQFDFVASEFLRNFFSLQNEGTTVRPPPPPPIPVRHSRVMTPRRVALVQAAFRGKIARARYARLRVTAKGRPLRYYALKIQVRRRRHSRRGRRVRIQENKRVRRGGGEVPPM